MAVNFTSSVGTLTADTVATVTLTLANMRAVTVVNRGTDEIWYTYDVGSDTPGDPAVATSGSLCLPAGVVVTEELPGSYGTATVKLISTGTPTYSVEGREFA